MLCWAKVKGHMKKHNKKFTLSAIRDLTYEGFCKVGPCGSHSLVYIIAQLI